jgi:hypothetical protein
VTALQEMYEEERATGRGHHAALRALAVRVGVDKQTIVRGLERAGDPPKPPKQPPPRREPAGGFDPAEAVGRFRALRSKGRGFMSAIKRTSWQMGVPQETVLAAVRDVEPPVRVA